MINYGFFFNLLLYFQLFIVKQYEINACLSNGICGSDPFCLNTHQSHSSLQSTSRLFSPHSSCQSSGCSLKGNNYGCGPYGCYKIRIHGLTNFQPNFVAKDLHNSRHKFFLSKELEETEKKIKTLLKVSPNAAKNRYFSNKYINFNHAFLECCKDRQLPDECLEKCNFENYTKITLTNIFLKIDKCPVEALNEIQFCAAQGGDHRNCCQKNGVTYTKAGTKCLTFCDQRPGKKIQLDLSYIPCFNRFDNIKTCFKQDLNNRNLRLIRSKTNYMRKNF